MSVNLKEVFDANEGEFLKFERVANQRSRRPDIHAFLLLEEIAPGDSSRIVACGEHDQIWLDTDIEKLADVATEEQITELCRCGVWLDEEVDSLSMYV